MEIKIDMRSEFYNKDGRAKKGDWTPTYFLFTKPYDGPQWLLVSDQKTIEFMGKTYELREVGWLEVKGMESLIRPGTYWKLYKNYVKKELTNTEFDDAMMAKYGM